MSTRTVRLDAESEQMLEKVRRAKGLSVSAALKRGLVVLSDALDAEGPTTAPYALYQTLDLGPGGSGHTRARHAKAEVARMIRQKARR